MLFKNFYRKILFSLYVLFFIFAKSSIGSENSIDQNVEKEIIISSENASFDQKSGLIILKEKVHLIFNNMIFKSDEMALLFEETKGAPPNKMSQIRKISAEGNVFFQHEDQIITSNLATFFPKENEVSLTGNVKIVSGERAGITSEKMIIDLKSGTSNFIGDVSSKILLEIKN